MRRGYVSCMRDVWRRSYGGRKDLARSGIHAEILGDGGRVAGFIDKVSYSARPFAIRITEMMYRDSEKILQLLLRCA